MVGRIGAIVLTCVVLGVSGQCVAAAPPNDGLTMKVAKAAFEGWELFQAKKFESAFRDGQYTDPSPERRGYEFWSNGRFARLDRDSNGYHETVFLISGDELDYVGTLGAKGNFVDITPDWSHLKDKTLVEFESETHSLK